MASFAWTIFLNNSDTATDGDIPDQLYNWLIADLAANTNQLPLSSDMNRRIPCRMKKADAFVMKQIRSINTLQTEIASGLPQDAWASRNEVPTSQGK